MLTICLFMRSLHELEPVFVGQRPKTQCDETQDKDCDLAVCRQACDCKRTGQENRQCLECGKHFERQLPCNGSTLSENEYKETQCNESENFSGQSCIDILRRQKTRNRSSQHGQLDKRLHKSKRLRVLEHVLQRVSRTYILVWTTHNGLTFGNRDNHLLCSNLVFAALFDMRAMVQEICNVQAI